MIKQKTPTSWLRLGALATIFVSYALLSSTALAQTRQGGITGGGGHLVPAQPTPTLLDLYELGDQVPETYKFINEDKVSVNKDSLKAPLRMENISVAKFIEERLSLWEPSSPRLIQALRYSLKNTKWYITPFIFGVEGDKSFEIPKSIETKFFKKDLIKVAYYDSTFGVWLSARVWNQGLGDLTKSGILIHESLRQMQIRYAGLIEERNLQKLTAYILLATPGQWLPKERTSLNTLDTAEFLGDQVNGYVTALDKREAYVHDFQKSACSIAQAMKNSKTIKSRGYDEEILAEEINENISQLKNICATKTLPSNEIVIGWTRVAFKTLRYLDRAPELEKQRHHFFEVNESMTFNSIIIGMSPQTETFQDLEAYFKRAGDVNDKDLSKHVNHLKTTGIILGLGI